MGGKASLGYILTYATIAKHIIPPVEKHHMALPKSLFGKPGKPLRQLRMARSG